MMALPNRNVSAVLARSPVPTPAIAPQVYTATNGLSTPIKQIGLATQTGQPFFLQSINGDTTQEQKIVSGGGCTVKTEKGTTTVSVP